MPASSQQLPASAWTDVSVSGSWARLTSLVLVLVGTCVLIGWQFEIPWLIQVRPGWVNMKANTAIGLVLSGIALWQLQASALAGWKLRLTQFCAGLAALIGMLTLAEYVAGWHLGIDTLFFVDSASVNSISVPGRMDPNAASAMLFGNAALLLIAGASNRSIRHSAAGSLAILTVLLGLFGAAGYIGALSDAYVWGQITSMALHSSLAFILLGIAGLRIAWLRGNGRLSIGAPMAAGSVLGMLILVGLSLESFRNTRQFVDRSQWVAHTEEVRTAISDLNAALSMTHNAERGFAITGRADFLASYTLGNRRTVEINQRLRELTINNPRQQARLADLNALLEKKLDFTQKVVDARQVGGAEPAASLISTGDGQALLDAIYALTRQMDNDEQNLLSQRNAETAALFTRTFLVLPIGTLLALGLFLGLLLHLNAEMAQRRRGEAATRASETRLQSILDNAPAIVWVKDLQGRYSFLNREFEKIFGLARDHVLGKSDHEIFAPEAAERLMEIDRRALAQDANVEAVDTLNFNGTPHTFLSVRVPLRNEQGEHYALCGISSDITERETSAAALRESEARFRSLVMATSQVVWVADANGQVNRPLPSWQEFTGQSDAETKGAGWIDALHPDDTARALDVWKRCVESRSLYEVEYRVLRHDGIYRNLSARGVAVTNNDGSVREWVGSCADVTDIRKAEAERDRFFSLSLDLMCIANSDGYFHRINPAFEKVLGFKQEELLSRPFLDFVHPEDRQSTLEVLKSLNAGATVANFENRYMCTDASYRWLHWSCAAVVEYRQLYLVAHDITERKRVDAELRQLNVELDERVVERTAQLEMANRELEAFTYSVSHDLRAPLRGIDSFSLMVLEDYGPKLDDEGRRMLSVVRSESQRMGQLIDDLLKFSRLGRLEMQLQCIDMNALLVDVIDKLGLPPGRERQISVGLLPKAQGDRNLIQHVWVNLLSNAVKFTSNQAAPAIEVGGAIADGFVTYYVKDNGAGFDPRYVHKLFAVFQRLHTEEEFEGTGVGLALVQRIVNRHGGNVRAEGQVNKGATFYFSLPVPEEDIS